MVSPAVKLLRWYMESDVNKFIMLKILPYVRFSMYYTSMRGWKYQRGYKLLKPGDIILCKDKLKLTAFLVPGEFTHACLCVDREPGCEFEVGEMTQAGFTKSCFFDVCKESDRVCIYRCKDWDVEYAKKVVEKCKSLLGTPYDYEFKLGVKSLYCSEMIVVCDAEKRLHADYTDIVGLGTEYISPSGLAKADNIECIWDSDKEITAA